MITVSGNAKHEVPVGTIGIAILTKLNHCFRRACLTRVKCSSGQLNNLQQAAQDQAFAEMHAFFTGILQDEPPEN